jgi:hypothetical protein
MHCEYASGLPFPEAWFDPFDVVECDPAPATPGPFDALPHPVANAPAASTAQATSRWCRLKYMSAPSS